MNAKDLLTQADVNTAELDSLIASEQKVLAKRKADAANLPADAVAGVAMEMDSEAMAEQLVKTLSSNQWKAIAVAVLKAYTAGGDS